jgi:hypothetical protein
MRPTVKRENRRLAEAHQPLKEVKVDPDLGTVFWPTGADLDPLVLYSKVTGGPIELAKPVLIGP